MMVAFIILMHDAAVLAKIQWIIPLMAARVSAPNRSIDLEMSRCLLSVYCDASLVSICLLYSVAASYC